MCISSTKKAKTAQEGKGKLLKEEGELQKSEITRLEKVQEKLTSSMTSWESCFMSLRGCPANGPSVEEHVPKFAIDKAEVQKCAIQDILAQLDLAVTTKRGKAKELIAAVNAALKASKPCLDNLEGFVEAARDHVGAAQEG